MSRLIKSVGFFSFVLAIASVVASGAALAITTLTMWDWHEPRVTFTKPFIQQYEKMHPDIKIQVQIQPDFESKLAVALASNSAPDIIQMHNQMLPRFCAALTPYPEDLFPREQLKKEFFAFEMTSTYKGEVYSLPLGLMSGLVYYNCDYLESAGMSAPPTTWKDFRTAASKLTKVGADGTISRSGFRFLWDAQWLWTDLVYQLGGWLFRKDGVNFDSPEGVRAAEFLLELRNAKVDNHQVSLELESGKAAMLYRWAWYEGFINRSEIAYGVSRLPSFTGDMRPALGRNNVELTYSVPKTLPQERKRKAFEFIKWLTSNEDFVTGLSLTLGTVPSRQALWRRPEVAKNPSISALVRYIPYTVHAGAVLNWYMDDLLGQFGNQLRAGVTAPSAILADLQRKGDILYKEKGPGSVMERLYSPPEGKE